MSRRPVRWWLVPACVVPLLALAVPPAEAQGMAERLRRRAEEAAKRKVEERVERKASEGTDRVLDAAERAMSCAVTDEACIAKAKQEGKEVVVTGGDGKPLPKAQQEAAVAKATGGTPAGDGEAAAPGRPGEGAWSNYDFIPGEKPLLVDDFSRDVVGDFPRRLEADEGNVEVVEWKGRRWLRMNGSPNRFTVPAAGTLPSRWTLEFDLAAEQGECWVYPGGKSDEGEQPYLTFGGNHAGGANLGGGRTVSTREPDLTLAGTPYTARILLDGRYVKAYVNERRVVNIPNLTYTRSDGVYFYCDGDVAKPMFVTNIRLSAGGRPLYDALVETGRVATQGIYFDTGSDRLRPESTPTLKEIGAMLRDNADLRLVIEGHTDNTGAAATNLALSQQRAEAVRAHLVATFGIAADRLSAKGLGQTVPVAPNTTPEGRQQNRRVELVRQP